MNAVQAEPGTVPWRRRWWTSLAVLEAAIDYSTTDYLLDRIAALEGGLREVKAELEEVKARKNGP